MRIHAAVYPVLLLLLPAALGFPRVTVDSEGRVVFQAPVHFAGNFSSPNYVPTPVDNVTVSLGPVEEPGEIPAGVTMINVANPLTLGSGLGHIVLPPPTPQAYARLISAPEVDLTFAVEAPGGAEFVLADQHGNNTRFEATSRAVECFGIDTSRWHCRDTYVTQEHAAHGVQQTVSAGTGTRTCADILRDDPAAQSGVYELEIAGKKVDARCNMTHMGGGWTEVAYIEAANPAPFKTTKGTMWRDFFLQLGGPRSEPRAQYWYPISEFSEAVEGNDLEILVTSPDRPDKSVHFVGNNAECMFHNSWHELFHIYNSYTIPEEECSTIPGSIGVTYLDNDVYEPSASDFASFENKYNGDNGFKRFFYALPLMEVTTSSSSMPVSLSMKINLQDVYSIVIQVRRYLGSYHADSLASHSLPAVRNHYPMGPGSITDTVGSLGTLSETGSISRVSSPCGGSSTGALRFSASDQYLELGNTPGIHYSGDMGFSFWFKFDTLPGAYSDPQSILSYLHDATTSSGWEVYLSYMSPDTAILDFWVQTTGGNHAASAGTLKANTWYRVNGGFWQEQVSSNYRVSLHVYDETTGERFGGTADTYNTNPLSFESTGNRLRIGTVVNAPGPRSFLAPFEMDEFKFVDRSDRRIDVFKRNVEGSNGEQCHDFPQD